LSGGPRLRRAIASKHIDHETLRRRKKDGDRWPESFVEKGKSASVAKGRRTRRKLEGVADRLNGKGLLCLPSLNGEPKKAQQLKEISGGRRRKSGKKKRTGSICKDHQKVTRATLTSGEGSVQERDHRKKEPLSKRLGARVYIRNLGGTQKEQCPKNAAERINRRPSCEQGCIQMTCKIYYGSPTIEREKGEEPL